MVFYNNLLSLPLLLALMAAQGELGTVLEQPDLNNPRFLTVAGASSALARGPERRSVSRSVKEQSHRHGWSGGIVNLELGSTASPPPLGERRPQRAPRRAPHFRTTPDIWPTPLGPR
jgi:hypothetical protein